MKHFRLMFLLLILISGFIGYWMEGTAEEKNVSATAQAAREYLEQQEYTVLSYEQQSDRYQLTDSKLESLPYSFEWGSPGNDPGPYIGKTVNVETFIVQNHSLDHWECCEGVKSKGKAYTHVFVVDNQVIGGTSAPYGIEQAGLVGGYWSLDGREAEE